MLSQTSLRMSDLQKLQDRVRSFNDARDWHQFHTTKDTAISLAVEAAELLNEFKWKSEKHIADIVETDNQPIADEIMDVLYHVLLLCDQLGIDIPHEFERKMQKNEAKYPVDQALRDNEAFRKKQHTKRRVTGS